MRAVRRFDLHGAERNRTKGAEPQYGGPDFDAPVQELFTVS
jgi:hypothetical protein